MKRNKIEKIKLNNNYSLSNLIPKMIDKINEIIEFVNNKDEELTGDQLKDTILSGNYDNSTIIITNKNEKFKPTAILTWGLCKLYENAPYRIK